MIAETNGNLDDLLGVADRAMYTAKADGKGRYEVAPVGAPAVLVLDR